MDQVTIWRRNKEMFENLGKLFLQSICSYGPHNKVENIVGIIYLLTNTGDFMCAYWDYIWLKT